MKEDGARKSCLFVPNESKTDAYMVPYKNKSTIVTLEKWVHKDKQAAAIYSQMKGNEFYIEVLPTSKEPSYWCLDMDGAKEWKMKDLEHSRKRDLGSVCKFSFSGLSALSNGKLENVIISPGVGGFLKL